jgi:3-oxoacyl-[acyl-carrier protein] reductase
MIMPDQLQNKIAFVTGAGSGIGLAIAQELAARGAKVLCVDISAEKAAATAQALPGAVSIPCDVADTASVDAAVAAAQAEGVVDILVNCAGILDGLTPVLETSDALWDKVLGINLKGMFQLTRAFLPGMVEKRDGAIINIASIAGMVAGAGGAAYTTSKHAVIGLTRQTSIDYSPFNVRVNAVCPGAINTTMTTNVLAGNESDVTAAINAVPAKRLGEPGEIAKMVAFLASEDALYIHGSVFPVDGGWTAR